MQTRQLTEGEFKATMTLKMHNITENATGVLDIWSYVDSVTAADLAPDASGFGAAGSPTWVEGVRAVTGSRTPERIEGTDPEEIVAKIVASLTARGSLTEGTAEAATPNETRLR